MGAITLSKDTFIENVGTGVTLVDFWAPWCGPCRIQLPVVDQLADELKGKVTVSKVNVDEEPELASAFGIMSIPTLMTIKDRKVIEQMMGVQSKEILESKLLSATSN
jgi:thioredoxin 1